jgi:hypothetical protein
VTQQARAIFNATLDAVGTQSSAGDRDRRVASAVKNPR